MQAFDIDQTTFDVDGKVTRKKPTKRYFNSEIVKVGKTLTKHLRGSRKISAVVYISSPHEILRLFKEGVSELHLVIGHKKREELLVKKLTQDPFVYKKLFKKLATVFQILKTN